MFSNGFLAELWSKRTALPNRTAIWPQKERSKLVTGAKAQMLTDCSLLKSMLPGTVLVDVAIDQSGCFETSRATAHAALAYECGAVIHYRVATKPGSVPVTLSHALHNATLPFGLPLANVNIVAVRNDPRAGLNLHRRRVTHRTVAEGLGLTSSLGTTDLDSHLSIL
jgi:alanine dehydrogenase